MSARILIAGPRITEKEIRCVTEAVADGWYANASKYQTNSSRPLRLPPAAATPWRCRLAPLGCISSCWHWAWGPATR
jgi:hypothetical protein